MFIQQGYQSVLMRLGTDDQITGHQETVEKVFGAFIVADIVKSSVGGIGSVKECMVAIVLKVNVKVVVGILGVVEPG